MSHFEAETLAARLARKGPLTIDDAVAMGVGVARALDALHRQGRVHGAVRPSTILLEPAGVRLVAATGPESHEAGYRAPEQLAGAPPDARSDLFGLGCVLYEAVSGWQPFPGGDRAALLSAMRAGRVAPLAASQPMAPPSFVRMIHTCLAADPDQRWQSAGDFARELGWVGTLDQPASERMEDATRASPGRVYGVIGLAAGVVLSGVLRACG